LARLISMRARQYIAIRNLQHLQGMAINVAECADSCCKQTRDIVGQHRAGDFWRGCRRSQVCTILPVRQAIWSRAERKSSAAGQARPDPPGASGRRPWTRSQGNQSAAEALTLSFSRDSASMFDLLTSSQPIIHSAVGLYEHRYPGHHSSCRKISVARSMLLL